MLCVCVRFVFVPTCSVVRCCVVFVRCPLQGEDHICCSALSPCGGWLSYSTVSGVRLYRLQHDNNNISIDKVGGGSAACSLPSE